MNWGNSIPQKSKSHLTIGTYTTIGFVMCEERNNNQGGFRIIF